MKISHNKNQVNAAAIGLKITCRKISSCTELMLKNSQHKTPAKADTKLVGRAIVSIQLTSSAVIMSHFSTANQTAKLAQMAAEKRTVSSQFLHNLPTRLSSLEHDGEYSCFLATWPWLRFFPTDKSYRLRIPRILFCEFSPTLLSGCSRLQWHSPRSSIAREFHDC